MKEEKQNIGALGEDAAARYLRKNHYRIVERNYTSGKNEIDIIAENREFLVFVEVKSRTYSEDTIARFGRACEAVDARKQHCLLVAARAYCAKNTIKKKIRMDVVEVYFLSADTPVLRSIHHMPDAFRIE